MLALAVLKTIVALKVDPTVSGKGISMSLFGLIVRCKYLSVTCLIFTCLSVSASVKAQADLQVVKSGPSIVVADTDITYTLSVTNVSQENSSGTITLTDVLPSSVSPAFTMTFVSEQHDPGWTCMTPTPGSSGTITCTFTDPFLVEQSSVFTFVFH